MKPLILTIALTIAGTLDARSEDYGPGASLPVIEDMDRLAAMPDAGVIAVAESVHPAGLYLFAWRLFARGEEQEAAKWMYIGQLRYRTMMAANPDPDAAVLFSALTEQVARPINEYIGGNVDEWLAAIDAALAWDATHPNVLNPAETHATVTESEREKMRNLRQQIEDQREDIPRLREEAGLENR